MIDQDKMRALALKVGGVEWYEAGDSVCLPDGDTIACCQSSIGHMPEPIHYDDMVEYLVSVSPAKILKLIDTLETAEREREKLRAELEAAAADKRDQFARLLTIIEKDSEWADARAVDWTRGVLMATLKVALAQRQGEGS
ncbi:hypothetical protein [Burkholderia cenocepacia]|uniref:hypothetical protein n=1 Tax=Burkholderia cenocepacia TaxID=95486 RepID=UPI001E37F26E|nr:hypothetical protein [Burkholderia cenocepacia]